MSTVEPEPPPSTEPNLPPAPPRRHSNLEMDGIRIATLAVLTLTTLMTVFLMLYLMTNVREQREVNECYQNQADQLLSSIVSGRDAARQERTAQLAMLNTILDPGSSVEARRRAVEDWRESLTEADQTRADAPAPIPRCIQLKDQ